MCLIHKVRIKPSMLMKDVFTKCSIDFKFLIVT